MVRLLIPGWRRALGWAAALAALCILAGGVAALAPGMPPCLFHSLTGLHCPGCGMTRALRLALRGHMWASFWMNPLMYLAGLPLGGWLIAWAARRLGGRRAPTLPAWVAWAALAMLVGFTVLRNIPGPPFCWLAPGPLP
ncbi:MAG: DUF2752 domain-containing protein [Christensenellales bacterium]|jgi:hypothetical protein